MKSFVKRFLSSAIAAAMLLTSAAFPTIASAAEVTYLYADLYGIDVVMSEAVGDPDAHTVEVTDSTGAPVDFTLMAMAEGETLATDVLSINFTTPINIGEVYTVTVDGTTNNFRVNKYSSVNFDNVAAGTNVEDDREIKEDDVSWIVAAWAGTTTEGNNDGIGLVTDNADFGASSTDKKLILYNRDSNLVLKSDMPTMDATIYADVTMYGVGSATVNANDFFLFGRGSARNDSHNLSLSSSTVETKQAHAQLSAVTDGLENTDEKQYFDEDGKYIKGSGGDPVYDYYAGVWNGAIDMNLKNGYAGAKARTASYGAAASVAGKLNSITVDNTKETLAEQFVYSIDKTVVPTTVRAAARVYDNNTDDEVSGYYGGFAGIAGEDSFNYTGTSLDETTRLYSINNKKKMGLSSNSTNIKVVDNVLVTTCSVADSSVEAPALTGYYADLYGVDLVYAEDPTEAVNSLAINPVIKDNMGNVVASSFALNTKTNVVSVFAEEMLETDAVYTISAGGVEKKFYINKIFEEGFNDQTASNSYADSKSGSNNDITWTAYGSPKSYGGAFITSDEKLGASNNDKKAVLYQRDSCVRIDNELPNVTFYATTQTYDFINTAQAGQMLFTSGTGKTKGHLYKFSYNPQRIFLSHAYGENAEYENEYDGVSEADYITRVTTTNGVISKTDTTIPADTNLDGEDDTWKANSSTTSDAADKVINFGTVTKAPEVKRAMRAYDFDTEDADPGYFGGFSALEGESAAYTGTGYNNKTGEIKDEKCGLFVSTASILVADDLMITTFVDVDPDREPAAVTKVYGDSYGMEIEFDKELIALDYLGLQITDADGNEVEVASTEVNGTTLRLTYKEMLARDVKHTISFGNNEREFIVHTVFEENFDDITENVDPAALATITQENWEAKQAVVTADSKWGAKAADKKLLLHNKGALTSKIKVDNELTISAVIENYHNGNINSAVGVQGRFYPSAQYLWVGNSATDNYRIVQEGTSSALSSDNGRLKTAEGSDIRPGYPQGMGGANLPSTVVIEDPIEYAKPTNIAWGLVGYGYGIAEYPYEKQPLMKLWHEDKIDATSNPNGWAPANVTDAEGNVVYRDIKGDVTAPQLTSNIAMRVNGDEVDYFADFTGKATPSLLATGVLTDTQKITADTFSFGYYNNAQTVTLIDDILVTTFVDVDPDREDAAVVGDPYADIYGIDVEFDKEPFKSEYAATILDKNKNEVAFTTAVETITETVAKVDENGVTITQENTGDDKTTYPYVAETEEVTKYIVHYNFVEPIARDEAYRITIGDSFDKFFTAKTVIFENFDNLEDATTAVNGSFLQGDSTADANSKENGAYKVKGSGWYATMNVDGNKKYSGAWIADTQLGSEKGDKKLALLGTSVSMKNAIDIPLNSTISADIQGYFLTGAAQSQSLVGYVDSHGKNGKAYAYSMELSKSGAANLGWAYYGNNGKPNPTENNKKSVNYTAPVGELNVATEGTFTPNDSVKTAGKAVTSVVRTYDNVLAGYMIENGSATYVGTMLDTSDAGKLKTNAPKQLRNIGGFAIESRGDLTVVDNVLITTSVIENAVEAEIKDVYADIYGLEIALEAEPSKTQKENFVVENAKGEKVELTTEYDEDLGVLRAAFAEPIKTDIAYKLSIGDSYVNKGLIVNKVFEENFDDITENVDPAALPESITGEGWSATNAFVTDDTKWGASSENKMLGLDNSGQFATDVLSSETSVSVAAKVITYVNGDAQTTTGGFWTESNLRYGSNGAHYTVDYGVMTMADGFQAIAPGETYAGTRLYRPVLRDRSFDQNSAPTADDVVKETSVGLIGDGLLRAAYPYTTRKNAILTWTDTKTSTVTEGTEDIVPAIRKPAKIDNYAIRIKNNEAVSVLADLTGTQTATPAYVETYAVPKAGGLTNAKLTYINAGDMVSFLDDLLVTTFTIQDEFVATGPAEINVTDIYGKADGVYVEFDEALEATDNFDAIEVYEDGARVDTTATVNGNIVKLAADGGIKSGAIYRVVVPADFQPNEDLIVKTESAKNFKLTIYADSLDDVVKATDSGVAEIIDDKLVLRGGEFTLPQVANATNYNVSFDAKVYTTAMTDANNDEENAFAHYNKVTPTGIKMWYNGAADNKANGYEWAIGSESLTKQVYSADGMNSQAGDAVPYAPIAFGDALYADGGFTVFTGEEDEFENWMLAADNNATLDDDFEVVLKSQRTAADYKVVVDKSGRKATYSLNGEVVSSFDGTENAAGASEGIFGVSASVEEFVVIENIYAYSYEEIKDIAIELTEDGKVKVNNVSSTEKPVVIVVATYDSNNAMIDAWVADGVNSLAGFGEYNESYTVDTTGAVKTKAFVWDSMTSLIPYCTPAQR